MNCKNCGNELRNNDSFCSKCGSKVEFSIEEDFGLIPNEVVNNNEKNEVSKIELSIEDLNSVQNEIINNSENSEISKNELNLEEKLSQTQNANNIINTVENREPIQENQKIDSIKKEPNNKELSEEDKTKANVLTIVSILLIFIVPLLPSINSVTISKFIYISHPVGLAILIYTRIQYPKHIFSKVIFILLAIFYIFMLAAIGLFFWSCIYEISKCADSAAF